MFMCYILSFNHLEGISVRYFFHKITPHSVVFCFFFSLKSLLLLAEEHGRAIAVYIQTSWRLEKRYFSSVSIFQMELEIHPD